MYKLPEIFRTFAMKLHSQNVIKTILDHAFQNAGKHIIPSCTPELLYQKIHRFNGQTVICFPVFAGIANFNQGIFPEAPIIIQRFPHIDHTIAQSQYQRIDRRRFKRAFRHGQFVFFPKGFTGNRLIGCRRPVFHVFGQRILFPHTSVTGTVDLFPATVIITP